ncbi:hypothetical protein [Cupriavidus sp. WS]|uniref:hypothetical protein n=1 Tax=Cupriavidus sp. WS TaxID=1312922 RepID=UPI0012DEA89D|nr:hypothetical protein [Cupriavidus sp. WS]
MTSLDNNRALLDGSSIDGPVRGLDVAKQQRNLLLMQPLFELALRLRHADAGGGAWSGLDTHYLSLSLLLFIMDGGTLGKGRTFQEAITHTSEVVRRMKSELSDVQAQTIAREVLDTLHNNLGKKAAPFSYDYYDGAHGRTVTHTFFLLRYERSDEDDEYFFRVSDEGFLVYLGMLDFGAANMQALMEKMLLEFIRRGNVDQALDASQRALYEGRRYFEQIASQLLRARRLPDSVSWKEDVSPHLQAAREHLDTRVQEEHHLLQAATDSLNAARDATTREKFVRLHSTVNDGLVGNTRLLQLVGEAGERYRKAARALFRTRRRGGLPNLEDTVLPEMLQLDQLTLLGFSETLGHALFGLSQPRLFHYEQVFNALLSQQAPEDAPQEDDGEMLVLEDELPRFSAEDRDRAEAWLRVHFDAHRQTDIERILDLAEAEGLGPLVRQYMTFMMYRAFSRDESPFPVDASVQGRFENQLVEGSKLVFTQRMEQPTQHEGERQDDTTKQS